MRKLIASPSKAARCKLSMDTALGLPNPSPYLYLSVVINPDFSLHNVLLAFFGEEESPKRKVFTSTFKVSAHYPLYLLFLQLSGAPNQLIMACSSWHPETPEKPLSQDLLTCFLLKSPILLHECLFIRSHSGVNTITQSNSVRKRVV